MLRSGIDVKHEKPTERSTRTGRCGKNEAALQDRHPAVARLPKCLDLQLCGLLVLPGNAQEP